MAERYGSLCASFTPWNSGTLISFGGLSYITGIIDAEFTKKAGQMNRGRFTIPRVTNWDQFIQKGRICSLWQSDTISNAQGIPVREMGSFLVQSIKEVITPSGEKLIEVSGMGQEHLLTKIRVWNPIGTETVISTTLTATRITPWSTTLAVGAPTGNDSATLTSATNVEVGDEVRITMEDLNVFVGSVTSVDPPGSPANTITYSPRIPGDAGAGKDVTFRKARMPVTSTAGFAPGQRVVVTKNSGTHTTAIVTVNAVDSVLLLRDGLTSAADTGKAVNAYDYSEPTTNDITDIMGYASGWALSFPAGGTTGTEQGTAHVPNGASVWELLVSASEQTGEMFRPAGLVGSAPQRRIMWLRTAQDLSMTLYLRNTSEAVSTDTDEWNRGVVHHLKRVQEQDLVTRVYVVPADARISFGYCSEVARLNASVEGFNLVESTDIYQPDYVELTAAVSSYGVHEASMRSAGVNLQKKATLAELQQASDQMLYEAMNYIWERQPRGYWEARVHTHRPLYPGSFVTLTNTVMDPTTNTTYYVLEARERYSARDGVVLTDLVLSSELRTRPTAVANLARQLKAVETAARQPIAAGASEGSYVIESGGTGGDHGSLTGLADNDHAQYLLRSGGTMTGNIAFSGAQTVDGTDISAHVADANAHHNAATAGNSGISVSGAQAISAVTATDGGLELSSGLKVKKPSESGLTLDSTGLSVAPNSTGGIELNSGVRVKLPANSGITRDANGIYLSPSSLTASSTNAVSGSGHTHAITASSNTIGAGSAAILASNATGELALERLGVGIAPDSAAALYVRARAVDDYTIWLKQLASQTADMWRVENSSGNPLIRLTGGGNLESGTPAFVSGSTGWRLEPIGNAEFNNVRVRGEFHASVFVADEISAAGGQILVKTASRIAPKVGGSDNKLPASINSNFTLRVQGSWATEENYFAANSIIRIKYLDRSTGVDIWDVYVQVVTVGTKVAPTDDMPATYPLTCAWRYGGAANLQLPTGVGIVKWTVNGNTSEWVGGLLLNGEGDSGVFGDAPFMDVFTVPKVSGSWSSPPTITPRVRLGNLRGVLGKSADEWGMAAGTDLSDATTAARYIVASDAGLALRNVDLKLYSGANPVVEMSQNGVVRFGTDTGSDTTTSFWHNSATGALRVGNLVSGKGNLYWDGTHLKLRMYTTDLITLDGGTGDAYFSGVIGIGSSGGIYQGTGTFGSPTTGLKIWRDSGVGRLATYSSGTAQVYFDTSGKLLAGGGKVTMDSTGVQINGRDVSSLYEDVSGTDQRITFKNASGSTTVGYIAGTRYTSGAANGVRIAADSSNYIHIYDVLNHEWKTGSGSGIQLRPGTPGVKIYSGNLDVEGGLKLGYTGSINYGQFVSDMQSGTYNAFILMDTVSVAHGMTSLANTAAYGTIGKRHSTEGGVDITGYTSTTRALQLEGISTNESTTKATTSLGAVSIMSLLKSGTSAGDMSANANLVVIRNNGTTRFIFDADGDLHSDSSNTTFDEHDDVALIRAADLALAGHDIDAEFGEWLRYNRADLERLGLVSAGGFVNMTRMQRLVMGALWQVNERLNRLERGV